MAAIPPLNQISQQHNNVFESYFQQVNPSGTGTIGAGEAARFLKKSGLPEGALHNIWELADQGSKGYLDKQGFYIALKLISLAQSGKEISLKCLGMQLVQPPTMGDSPKLVPSLKKASTVDTSWGIKSKDKQVYDGIFDSLKPVNGLLSGDKVRPVLLNSKLPVDVLGKIWDLADIDQDGSLDRDEFTVAMYLVFRVRDGEAVPTALPQQLVPPSKRNVSVAMSLPMSSSSVPVSGSIPPRSMPSSSASSSLSFPDQSGWVVSPTDKQTYDKMFQQCDTDKDGLVSGVEVKDILIASGLPQTALAHIWNLCDTKNVGMLNSEQFALAMYLIAQQKCGKELPQSLTPDMIPPTSRAGTSNVNDLSSIQLESTSNDFSAIKELDQITTDIEQLGREKASLQQEISQTEEAIRKRKTEIEDLRNELEKANKGLEILNQQKTDAQTRLDDLDQEKTKFKEMVKDVQSKCQDEEQMLNQLRSQVTTQQSSVKEQEQELQKGRQELDGLRKEEETLQQSVDQNKQKLETLKNNISTNKTEMTQVQSKIEKLNDDNNTLKDEISQLNSMSNNNTTSNTALNEFNYNFEARFKDVDQISARATAGSSPVSSISGFSVGSSGKIDEDDFKDTDPFKAKTDLFASNENESNDPFSSDDPFKSDPFKTVSFAEDPFAGDPFNNEKSTADPFNSDPFNSDPFKSNNKADEDGNDVKESTRSGPDPFSVLDPFGSGAFTSSSNAKSAFANNKAVSMESNSSDPFSSNDGFTNENPTSNKSSTSADPFTSDPFASSDPFQSKDEDPFSSKSTSSNADDPFASKNTDSQDPFSSSSAANASDSSDPFASTTTNSNDPFASSSNTNDPFTSTTSPNDPFASSANSADPFSSASSSTITDGNDPWFAFGSSTATTTTATEKTGTTSSTTAKDDKPQRPKPPSTSGPDDALEWAKRESKREEAERQKRMKELADQEEMEIALALKQSVESSSDA